jgi:hydrogenase/urease accessory protein HupE
MIIFPGHRRRDRDGQKAVLRNAAQLARGFATRAGRILELSWLMIVGTLFAHDPGISTAQGELRSDVLILTTGFAPADAQQLLPPASRTDERWTSTEFEAVRNQLVALAPQLWDVRSGERKLLPRDARVELLPGDNVSFNLVFPREPGGDKLTLRAQKLPVLPTGHRQFVIISDARGSVITKKLLSARDAVITVPLKTAPSGIGAAGSADDGRERDELTFWGFVRLGIAHIWTGYDHLLFLFALLVVCRSFRSIVAIVSFFTIAHSITLALATLNIVHLPSRFVEPAIAASIVFVGVENLIRRGEEPRGRWALTFAFGLIHGFGFASVLRDLGVGVGAQGVAMPLCTFNLGVEVGQVAVAAVVLPIVWQLRKRAWFVQWGVPVLSAVVALAGLYWLLQRTVFA